MTLPNGYASYNSDYLGDFPGSVELAQIIGLNSVSFGTQGDGIANDAIAFDRLITFLNAVGHPTNNVPISVIIPAGVYNIKAGGIRPLLVSNVEFKISEAAIFLHRDGSFLTLGSNASTTIQNIWVTGGQPRSDPGDTLAADCAWVFGVNVARVFIDNPRHVRMQIFKGVTTTTLSSIYVRGHSGSYPVDRHMVELDTTGNANAVGAGLFLLGGGGYAYVPPTNPDFSPKAITGATQTNPVVVTCTNHGYTTGDRIRHGGVTGMTQLNGLDATITRLTANTYSLDTIDGTGFGAYVSGGWAVELLWSWPYDTACVSIKGHWDTAEIIGGLYQHYPWLWNIEATNGTITYIFDKLVTWDFGGKGRYRFVLDGGNISHVECDGGWNFTCNEEMVRIIKNTATFITDLKIQNLIIGMSGGSILDDRSTDAITALKLIDNRIVGMGRARIGLAYFARPGNTGNNTADIRGNIFENPGGFYANGTTYLLPDIAIQLGTDVRYSCIGNDVYAVAGGTHYDIPSTSTTGGRQRLIRNNKCRLGGLPEYMTTTSPVAPASGAVQTNNTGLTQRIYLYGGTMTAVALNGTTIATGAGPHTLMVEPGETWTVTHAGAPTMVLAYRD